MASRDALKLVDTNKPVTHLDINPIISTLSGGYDTERGLSAPARLTGFDAILPDGTTSTEYSVQIKNRDVTDQRAAVVYDADNTERFKIDHATVWSKQNGGSTFGEVIGAASTLNIVTTTNGSSNTGVLGGGATPGLLDFYANRLKGIQGGAAWYTPGTMDLTTGGTVSGAFTAASLTASSGNITATSGNIIASGALAYVKGFNVFDHRNVKYWGAIGDGVTDDTAAFQACIDNALAIWAATGYNYASLIIIPEGFYIISGTLTISGIGGVTASVSLLGDGIQSTRIHKTTAGTLLLLDGVGRMKVANIYFDGTGMSSGSGVVLQSTGNSSGVVKIDQCQFISFPGRALYVSGSSGNATSGVDITDNLFLENGLTETTPQVEVNWAQDFKIHGNQFGVTRLTSFPSYGIKMDVCQAGTYMNNFHWNNVVGGYFKSSNAVRFVANRWEDSNREGVIFENTNAATILGNFCYSNGRQTANTYSGMKLINSDRNTIVGNQWPYGITYNSRVKYSLELDSNSSDNNIGLNNFGISAAYVAPVDTSSVIGTWETAAILDSGSGNIQTNNFPDKFIQAATINATGINVLAGNPIWFQNPGSTASRAILTAADTGTAIPSDNRLMVTNNSGVEVASVYNDGTIVAGDALVTGAGTAFVGIASTVGITSKTGTYTASSGTVTTLRATPSGAPLDHVPTTADVITGFIQVFIGTVPYYIPYMT